VSEEAYKEEEMFADVEGSMSRSYELKAGI
jgi:hypothetical protein